MIDEREAIEMLVRAQRALAEVIPADDERLRRGAADGGWSPAEHILHCALAMEMTAKAFRIARKKMPLPEPPLEIGKTLARKMIFTTWRIPSGAQAPSQVEPRVLLPADDLKARLESARDGLVDMVELVSVPRAKLWVEHVKLGAMGFEDWIRFTLVHSMHHRRLVKAMLS